MNMLTRVKQQRRIDRGHKKTMKIKYKISGQFNFKLSLITFDPTVAIGR